MAQGTCQIDGCDWGHYARGWCRKHYDRWWRTGDPIAVAVRNRSVTERFWAKVEVRGPDECWEWGANRLPRGYGQFAIAKHQRVLSHRQSWEIAHGPIPPGLQVLHRCDNPPCVNPAHLFLGTQADNIADMVAKGRHWRHALVDVPVRSTEQKEESPCL